MKFPNFLSLHLVVICLFSNVFAYTQELDTIKVESSFLKKNTVPIALIGSGTILNYINNGKYKVELQDKLLGDNTQHKTTLDDYIQYTPMVELYLFHFLDEESANNLFVKSKYLVFSQLGTSVVTHGLKRLANETRPNRGSYAFPSGHTSQAFAGASVLYHEYIDHNKLIAWSGYGFATLTGALRVVNNEHWVSDVLVGSGIPILVTNLIYEIEPLKKWDGVDVGNHSNLVPGINLNEGVSLKVNLIY